MKSEIYLRAFNDSDYLKSVKWRNSYEINKGLICRRLFVSEINEKQWIENANQDKTKNVKLAICMIENHKYIGNIYLTGIDHFNKKSGVGIFIGDSKYHNKGYASEALKLIMEHAFIDLGLQRIESKQFTSNIASIKLHEKCGFIKEGILRKYFFKDGKYNDIFVMSILRSEYLKNGN